MKTTYIDSNYWIYWFDERLPEHKYVDRIMQETIRKGVVVNAVTIMEVAHYFRNLSKGEFVERIEIILGLSTLKVVDFTLEILKRALSFVPQYSQFGLGARDCVIIATMEAVDVDKLLSHDMGFRKIRSITVADEIE